MLPGRAETPPLLTPTLPPGSPHLVGAAEGAEGIGAAGQEGASVAGHQHPDVVVALVLHGGRGGDIGVDMGGRDTGGPGVTTFPCPEPPV